MDTKKKHRIHQSRLTYQNPYAHVAGDDGELDAILPPLVSVQEVRGTASPKTTYSQVEIEKIAKCLRKTIWDRREKLGFQPNAAPISFTDPMLAFKAIGYHFDTVSSLGEKSAGNSEMAGFIDATNNEARVSARFPPRVQLFTAAHELGHAILHDARGLGLHREVHNDGAIKASRPPIEKQADQFAAAFLMPEKLFRQQFELRFHTNRFKLDTNNTHGLANEGHKKLGRARDLSRALATAVRFHSNSFPSLAEFFKLSTESVAIRIEYFELIDF